MRLNDRDIEKYLDEGKIIISPRPEKSRISGVSVDLTLGCEFRVFKAYNASCIDLSGSREDISRVIDQVMSNAIVLSGEERFVLHPGEFALSVTHESVTLPEDIVGWLDGRSSLARLGLMVHATAHRIALKTEAPPLQAKPQSISVRRKADIFFAFFFFPKAHRNSKIF